MDEEPAQPGEAGVEEASSARNNELEAPPYEMPSSGRLLRGSDLLTPDEASRSLSNGEGRFIIWAGERRSGKTTLSAELYERHRTGRAKTRFAGSRTLLGFEERMHPARSKSGRIKPHTPRTESDPEGRELLHLAVCADSAQPTHLVLADLPGETFRQLRDNEIDVSDVPMLRRADKLAIVVDGEQIADPRRRSFVISNAIQLVDRLAEGGVPNPGTELILLVTKLDLIEAAGEHAVLYWGDRESKLLERLRQLDPAVAIYRTSARDTTDSVDDGMDELMSWLLRPAPQEPATLLEGSSEPLTRVDRLRSPKALR